MSAVDRWVELCSTCNANRAAVGRDLCVECENERDRVGGVRLTKASAVKVRRASFLWAPRVPLGALAVLAGVPGQGKSHVTIDIAAKLTRGTLDGDLFGRPSAVVIASAEDAREFVMVPRLIAADADLDLVSFPDVQRDGLTDAINVPDDLAGLSEEMDRVGARLLIVDPLMAHIPTRLDGYKDQHVRQALAPLARLAEERSAAVIGVMHLNKRESGDLFSRVGGSGGFFGTARSALLVASDPDDPDLRVLAHGKANLSLTAPALSFSLRSLDVPTDEEGVTASVAQVEWLGESFYTVTDLLGASRPTTAKDDAEDWLTECLSAGPKPSAWIRKEAKAAGHSWRTIERAKESLGIVSDRLGGASVRWEWSLPPQTV